MKAADRMMLEAQAVAIEHVLWAVGQRMTAREVLLAAGINWPEHSAPSWHDCVRGLAISWRRLAWEPQHIEQHVERRVA